MFLVLGLCILFGVGRFWRKWMTPPPVELVLLDMNADSLVALYTAAPPTTEPASERKSRPKPQLFAFDPNGLPLEEWMKLGLSRKQAQAVHRYEQKGGRFRIKSDVQRLFVVSEKRYAEWLPFIQLPERLPEQQRLSPEPEAQPSSDQATTEYASEKVTHVRLNEATAEMLDAVPGIGKYTARQIIWYREKLGGFHSTTQLNEVKGVRPENLERMQAVLRVGGEGVRGLRINDWPADSLGKHPYLSWKQAHAIVAYREHHGVYHSPEDLLQLVLIDSADFVRLEPYLPKEVFP